MNTSPGNAVFLHSYSDTASGLLFLALLGGLTVRVAAALL